ncbi:MAG: DUF4168 domain-containing protein [Pseudomonadota bacterium]
MKRLHRAFAVTTAASLLFASPILAQTTEGAAGETVTETAPYSDAKIESFAAAAKSVEQIVTEYKPKIDAAETDEERRAIADEANGEMRSAVEETDGITIPEYTEIARAAQRDEVLMQKISERMRQAQPGEG